jgi:hypothetical protein
VHDLQQTNKARLKKFCKIPCCTDKRAETKQQVLLLQRMQKALLARIALGAHL